MHPGRHPYHVAAVAVQDRTVHDRSAEVHAVAGVVEELHINRLYGTIVAEADLYTEGVWPSLVWSSLVKLT